MHNDIITYSGGYIMKIIVFNTLEIERDIFLQYTKEQHEIAFHHERFALDCADMTRRFDAVILSGNCDGGKEALTLLHENNIAYVFTRSAGFDHIDLEAAKHFDMHVCHVPSYSPNAVSKFTITLALCATRNMKSCLKRVAIYDFSATGPIAKEIRNMTIGIIGTGRIGFETTKAFKGLGANIIAYDPKEREDVKAYANYVSLETLLSTSDLISLHIPLQEDTYHIINQETIAKMKQGVILINTSRGALVDANTLLQAIKSEQISHAALDVYEHEKAYYFKTWDEERLDDNLLKEMIQHERIIITPHVAFFSDEAIKNMAQITLQNLYDVTHHIPTNNQIL